jgi:integrase
MVVKGKTPYPDRETDFDIRRLGPLLPETSPPQGWVAKMDRPRVGKVWVGFFHISTTSRDGQKLRKKKEKTLGPASMPKHEALVRLSNYIEECVGRREPQTRKLITFADLWSSFSAVREGRWSTKTREDLQYLFNKHVIPTIGHQHLHEITLVSVQRLLNQMAEAGYSSSAVGRVRTYLKASFNFAAEEAWIERDPARKLTLPNLTHKSCERFLSIDELRAIMAIAPPREHLILRLLSVCGLRPSEVLALRIEDFEGEQIRIDEALKERQRGEGRIGHTKTAESDNFVPIPPDLRHEVETWILGHNDRTDPRAFLFPNAAGSAFGVGNFLKRHLKPLAVQAGVAGVTFQAFRRSSATHMQTHATVKDMQRHLRHSNPYTTLKHYAKVIPESLRSAVAALDAQIAGGPEKAGETPE